MRPSLDLTVLLSIPVSSIFLSASAALVNVTIDDTFGDFLTGTQISYQPPGVWKLGQNCTDCTAHPDPSKLQNGTWHDGTFSAVNESDGFSNQLLIAATTFEGIAVYVYCVLTHSLVGNSDMTFFIDGAQVGLFQQPLTGDNTYQYNVPVYVNKSLPAGQHTIAIVNGQVNKNQTLTLLDYIVYTRETNATADPTSSLIATSTHSAFDASGTPTPSMATTTDTSHNRTIIIAAVSSIGGLIVIIALVTYIVYYRRKHSRYNAPAEGILRTDPAPMDEEDPRTSGWVEGTWTGDDESAPSYDTGRRTGSTGKRKRGPSNASSTFASPPDLPPFKPAVPPFEPAVPPSTFRIPPSQLSRLRPEPMSPTSSFGNLTSPPPDSATYLLSPSAPTLSSHRHRPSETFLDMDMGQSYGENILTTFSSRNAHPFATAQAAYSDPLRQRSEATLGTPPGASTTSLAAATRGPAYQDRSISKKPSGSDLASSSAPSPPLSTNAPTLTSTVTTPTSTTTLVPKGKPSISRGDNPSSRGATPRRVDPVDPAMQPPRDRPSGRGSRERGDRARDGNAGQRSAQESSPSLSKGARRQVPQAEVEEQGDGQSHNRSRSGRRLGMMVSERDQRRFDFLDVPVDAHDSQPPSSRESG